MKKKTILKNGLVAVITRLTAVTLFIMTRYHYMHAGEIAAPIRCIRLLRVYKGGSRGGGGVDAAEVKCDRREINNTLS